MLESHPVYAYALALVVVFGVITFPILFFITAPYGRHQRAGWGPVLPATLAWVVMEAPAPLAFLYVFFRSEHATRPLPLFFLGLFCLHYFYRAFVFPFRMRGSNKTKPALTVGIAVAFNTCNGAINAFALTELSPHLTSAWLADPRFWLGLALFFGGYFVNHQSDAILRRLRGPGESGYKIPRGGLFDYVSSPNYFGEMVEWIGFALAAWTPAAAAFAFFTFANLFPRALANHRWYRERFSDYPAARRAVLPFVL
jgi:protein-S-isoprenylcysteine O-methyltransferase Ste14